jgi:hypothetical protein
MKESFVVRTVDYMIQRNLVNENTVLVVPSERLIAYIQKTIFEAYHQPVFSPKMVTIDRWIQQLTPDPIIEKTHLLFELYEIFKKNPVETGVTGFDGFLTWGQTLVNDFEEIDRYLVNPEQLFKNLRDIREIENWSFNQEELSQGQLKFMAFWDKLKPYYFALEARLNEMQVTTKAKAYKLLSQRLDLVFNENEKLQIVFAGFNALSEAEIAIMSQLYKMGRGHLLIDSDQFYLSDPQHEAGVFHRTLLSRLEVKELPFVSNTLSTKSMHVQLIECAQFTSQAQAIGFELTKIPQDELQDTLVLLAQEQLISTMLEHIPAQIQRANITIGLPIQQTVLKSWIDLQFRIQESYVRRESRTIYYKDYVQFMHHPFLTKLLNEEELAALYAFEDTIIRFNWQFVDLSKFPTSSRLNKVYEYFFTPWKNDWRIALAKIQQMNQFLDLGFGEEAEMEQAVIRKYADVVLEFQSLLERAIPDFSISTFRNLFNQHWMNTSIAFYGNPLDGLQIMGLLETRGVDFKHIFVLGLNDGNMPPSNPIQTLIPMDLRRYFGLPTPREKQGLFAHHFYRLLHQCERLFVTYSSSSDGMLNSEPSRYIQQLRLELARVNPNIEIEHKYLEIGSKLVEIPEKIAKTDEHIEAIEQLIERGITFSQIDKFLKCSKDYMYIYLLGFKDDVELEEELESTTTGSILHHVMENMYRPYLSTTDHQQQITPDILRGLEDKIPLFLDAAFKEIYTDDVTAINSGTNHVFYVVAQDMIRNVLRKERELLENHPERPLQILDLEKELTAEISLNINGQKKTIRLKGIVDRIDQWGDEIRIIDYKTGSIDIGHNTLSNKLIDKNEIAEALLDAKRKNKKSHVIQLLLYSYLYYQNTQKFTRSSAIVSFTNSFHGPFYLAINEEIPDQELLEITELFLETVISEMLDLDLPFEHNQNNNFCKRCNN